MRRDILLLTEMIEVAEQAQALTNGLTVGDLEADRQRRDALLWNFTVLGEAAGQLSDEVKTQFPRSRGSSRHACGTGLSMVPGRSIWTSCIPPRLNSFPDSRRRCA
jgi:hypothetical protein